MVAEPPLVCPDGVGTSPVVHAFSCKDNHQLIDKSVAIPVIQAPVDVTLREDVHDVVDQKLRILIIFGCAGVSGFPLRELHILQVEVQVKRSIALGVEIVAHRTFVGFFLIVFGIHDIVPFRHRGSLVALKA